MAFHPHAEDQLRKANKALCHIVKLMQKEGVKNLFLIKSKDIKMTEDAMIEATHPNDIGCIIYANAYKKKLKKVLR
jgi:putative acetylhydrolase